MLQVHSSYEERLGPTDYGQTTHNLSQVVHNDLFQVNSLIFSSKPQPKSSYKQGNSKRQGMRFTKSKFTTMCRNAKQKRNMHDDQGGSYNNKWRSWMMFWDMVEKESY